MTGKTNWISAGLVFLRYRNIDIATEARRAAATLEKLDERITGIRAISEEKAVVTGQYHTIRLTLREDVRVPSLRMPADQVLEISVKTLPGGDEAPFGADTILARATKTLHAALLPDHVQWIEKTAVISSADFMLATSQPDISPRRPSAPARPTRLRPPPLPAIESTHDMVQQRFITEAEAAAASAAARSIHRFGEIEWMLDGIIADMPDQAGPQIEDIRDERDAFRLSAWLLSIAVTCIALPVGVALILINLAKGENLRLASQTAALTGTFVTFNLHGATAETMMFVQGVLG